MLGDDGWWWLSIPVMVGSWVDPETGWRVRPAFGMIVLLVVDGLISPIEDEV